MRLCQNELILKKRFTEELQDLETKKDAVTVINEEINELVEAAKVEESDVEFAQGDALNARVIEFTITSVRAELRKTEENTEVYALSEKVRDLLSERTALNRD